MSVYTDTGWENTKNPWVYTENGWIKAKATWVYTENGWERQLYLPPIAVELSFYFDENSDDGSSVSSRLCESTVTGGSGTYTYQWTKMSGGVDTFAVNPSSPNTRFRLEEYKDETTFWKLIIIDSEGNIGVSPEVEIRLDLEQS